MQLNKRLKNCLIYLVLISFTTSVFAQNVVRVEQDQPSPFTGWCLTDPAMAKIVADKEQEGARCDLKLGKQEEELAARYNLDIGLLNARITTLEKELEFTNSEKNKEIEKLEKIALDKPNDYWYLFTAGGFVVGVGLTLGISWVLNLSVR